MTRTIAVTGAAGSIAYSLLFRLAAGAVYGQEPVRLRLLEVPQAVERLQGVLMELADCAYPTLLEATATTDPDEAFADADAALLIGAAPRKEGMDRADLLRRNGEVFRAQGAALGRSATADVRVVVVGNPANTNALIAAHHASVQERADGRRVDPSRFTALTRLDHNRALGMVAQKTGAPVDTIERVTIWGNHSNTQVPDLTDALIDGRSAPAVLADLCGGAERARAWVTDEFIPAVAGRGAAVISARGASSAASAAAAALDHLRDWTFGTNGARVSMAVRSTGEYGVPAGLVSSFPCTVDTSGAYQIVEGLVLDDARRSLLDDSVAELTAEREDAAALGFL
ncbi:malate dehydrogenase [Brevibacterium jeotgali]|uniref:Malate dehydrogenase n=1 Tax=Brevibacterium jeotgali TaxID=1262550 RepID=A0A2H1L2V6_9MICO|nr:malate dehydrogenase [Brevibacterium jeotgali]TWC02442.1 malate dehydrogenase [Brevibacterium jeotgali]SMY11234.1 malate dehydrogenase [Brevibacterium jeotgali]